jgi:ribosomal protein S18 acetylase RimI-like enzyme
MPQVGDVCIRVCAETDWKLWRGVRLAALEEAPYAYGSTLAQWQDASEERWRARMRDVPFNALAEVDGVPAGIACGMPEDDGSVSLVSMWVAPFARGRSIGDRLVGSVLDWARERDATAVRLDVVSTNAAAIALYRRNGFIDNGASHHCEIDGVPQIEMLYTFAR